MSRLNRRLSQAAGFFLLRVCRARPQEGGICAYLAILMHKTQDKGSSASESYRRIGCGLFFISVTTASGGAAVAAVAVPTAPAMPKVFSMPTV